MSFKELEIIEYVNNKLSSISHAVAVIHMVNGSKTGLAYPSEETLNTLNKKWGERVIIVIDCCQLRCSLSQLENYCSQGYFTLLTASKFFTGPPFSGAVLIPGSIVNEIETYLFENANKDDCLFPIGLSKYITQYEVPTRMKYLRKFLSQAKNWINIGLSLRWDCGLRWMERYHSFPETKVVEFAIEWIRYVEGLVNSFGQPYLQIISTEMGIVSIAVRHEGGEYLSVDELKEFHRNMLLSEGSGCSVMLGQPVKIASEGLAVVRIALGADMVVLALSDPQMLLKIQQDDQAVVFRMRYLAENWLKRKDTVKNILSLTPQSDSELYNRHQRNDNKLLLTEMPLSLKVDFDYKNTLDRIKIVGPQLYPSPEVAVLYDLDAFYYSVNSLFDAFSRIGGSYLHCFAIKSCPVSYILHLAVKHFGLGLEAASLGEVIIILLL